MYKIDIEKLYQKLIDTANKDGIITSDEQKLIDNIRKNIEKYSKILNESYADNIITADEQNDLYTFRKKIMEEALIIAKQDHKITQDEFSLLRCIKDILDDMEANETY